MKKTVIIILLILFGSAVGKAAKAESSKEVRNLVVEGNRLFRQEKYHEALEKYDAALTADPSYRYAMYNKAVALVQLASDDNKGTENDPRKVAAELFSQVAAMPQQGDLAAKAHYNLGNMAYNDSRFDEAINQYKGSLRINPDNRACRQNLLLAYQQQENQDENQDQQDQQQDQQDQQQQQDQQDQQQQQQEQQQQQQPQMTQSAEQLLQAMQNKENATRRKAEQQTSPAGRATDKPW